MMYQWNSQKLKDAFEQIAEVSQVEVTPPGGDVDSENLILSVNGSTDRLFIRGFHTTDYDIWQKDTSNVEVEMVELQDGQDCTGGLNSDDANVGLAYIKARQILVDDGAFVVNTLDPYF